MVVPSCDVTLFTGDHLPSAQVPGRVPGWASSARRAVRRRRLLPHASLAVVFVVPTEPVDRVVGGTRLVSPSRRPVEPLVHAPETVQPARVRRIGVVHDPIVERERGHTRTLPRVRQPVRTDAGCPFGEWPLLA